jgi:hypothetical protein
MAKPSPQKQETQVHPRFADDIIERIDAHVTRMMASTPGIEFSRADAVVSLVVRGLAAAEKGGKK